MLFIKGKNRDTMEEGKRRFDKKYVQLLETEVKYDDNDNNNNSKKKKSHTLSPLENMSFFANRTNMV